MATNPDEFYSDIFDQQDKDSQSVLRQSMYVGAQSEPDAAASDLKLSQSTGLPPQVVARNKERVKQVDGVDSIDYGYLIDNNPKVSDWIKDTQNASVSRDDLDNLMKHENEVKKYNIFQSFWKSLNSGAAAGNAMMARTPAALVDVAMLPGNLWLKAFGQSDKQVRSPEWLRNNDVAQFYDAQQEAWKVPELDKSIVEQVKLGDYAGAGKTLFSQLVANAPQQAVIIASAMSGRPVFGLGYAGTQAAAGANKVAQESGVDPASATIDAVAQGTIEAGFERMGTFGVFKKWESAIAKAVGKQSAKQVIKEFGKTMAYSTMAEGNEELWTQAGQDFVDYVTGVNPDAMKGIIQRSIDAGIVGAASGGAMTAPAATASGINLGRQIRQAEQTREFYLSLGNTVESSKLRERMPEKHREYVESLVKDSPIENIYVPIDAWDVFMQSKNFDPAVVANEVGINQEYDNAKETGTDIRIPLAAWANKVVGTEYYQGLADDIKFDPSGQTVNEVKVEQERIKTEMEQVNQQAQAEVTPQDNSQVVADKVAEQLKATGQFSDKDVKHLSNLWGSFTRAFGERVGLGPLEFFNINPVTVTKTEGLGNDTTKAPVPEQGQAGQTEEGLDAQGKEILNQQKYRVAFDIDGKVYEGRVGEIHAQLFEKLPNEVQEKYNSDIENQGFMSGFVDDGGEFQTRGDIEMRTGRVPNVEIVNDNFIKGKTTLNQPASSVISYVKDGKKYFTRLSQKELDSLVDEVKNIPTPKKGESQIHLDADTESLRRQGVELSRSDFMKGHSQAKKVLFQENINPLGAIIFGKQGGFDIRLLKDMNYSTFLHETGHAFLEILRRNAGHEDIKPMSDAVLKWLGIESWDKLERKHHEQWAQGFEKYLFEGKAPSQSLRNAFARFRVWLISVYKTLANIGVELSDEIRGVMDRMLATDDEIALAETQQGTLGMIQNPVEILGQDKGQRYLDAIMESKREAEATMQLKLMEEYQRERKSWWIDEYKKVREEVAKEVNARPEQIALSILQKSEMPDGSPVRDDLVGIKINTKDLIQYYGVKHDENVIPADYKGMEADFNVEMLESRIKDIIEFREEVGKIRKYENDYLKEELDKLPKRYLTSNKFAKTLDEAASDLGFESDQALLDKIIYNEELFIRLKDDLIEAKKELRSIQKSNRIEKYSEIKKSMQALPRGITGKNGISVDVVAQLFGHSSVEDFLDVLSRTRNRNELIKEIATQKMNDTYGEIYGDKQEMAEQANQAIHNDKREQVLRMELDYLASQHKPVMKDLIRTVSARIPSKQDVKKYAGQIIGNTPLREISPYKYRLAERRAAKEAGALFAQGNFEEALNAKRKELLNYELYREATEAQETVKKSLKNFKNVFKSDDKLSKSRDLDYVNAARSILGLYGIGSSEDDPYNHIEKTKAYEPEVYDTLVALVDAASENYGNYESVTFNQFMNMKQAVDAIWDISRRSRQIQINDEKVELDDVRSHLINRINELIKPSEKQKYTKSASDNDKFVRAVMGARAQARRVESWVDVMDGGNTKGWFTQAIWNPVIEGTQEFRIKNREYTQKFLDIIRPIEKSLVKKDIISQELNHIFRSKAELLGAMLHTGNESNLSKLLRGRGWGMFLEDGTLDRSRWDAFILRMQEQGIITKEDYDFIQSIWDLFEELKPQAQKAHKEMYGFYFNEITKDEFMTPWGKYRGGYAPAIVDPFFSEDAAIRQEKEDSEKINNSYMFPTTGRGFTKQRVERYAAPLAIDLRLVPQHINKVLRFTHIEPRVKDVGRLIRNPEFREVLRDLDPTVGQNMLSPWLQRAAQQIVETPDRGPAGWRLWRELRVRSGLNIMAGNVINTLQQFTGLSISAVKVKPQYLRNSMWNYMRNPKEVAATVVEQSDFMKTRTTTHIIEVQRNIDELLLNQNNYEKAIEYAKKHGYFLQVGTQNIVDMVVWPAAYDQSVAQGNSHDQAVRDADSAVRLTQGDFSPENVSNIEAGTAFFRAFTMFYSYFNMQANLLGTEFSKVARELGLKRGAGRMFYVYLFGFMIPAVVSELIMKSLSGEDWDKDDDGYMDEILAMFFGAQFKTATAMLPFVGQALNVAVNKFNKKWYDDDIRTSPAITMIESAVSAPHSVYKAIFDEGNKRTAIRDVLSLIGLMTGAPVAPLSKPIGYLSDVSEGNVYPENPLDFTRGLLTGRSGK